MTLAEVCHPLFAWTSRLYRLVEAEQCPPLDEVRKQVKTIFEDMHAQVMPDNAMKNQLLQVELPLMFFVDYIIKEGGFPFSDQWQELARERNELAGDEKFFDLLNETLDDPSTSATERLQIFYTCMALGFNGCHADDLGLLERKMGVIALRLNYNNDNLSSIRITPDAYKNVNTLARYKSPTRVLVITLLVAVALLIAVGIANNRMYAHATQPLQDTMDSLFNEAGKPMVDIVNDPVDPSEVPQAFADEAENITHKEDRENPTPRRDSTGQAPVKP